MPTTDPLAAYYRFTGQLARRGMAATAARGDLPGCAPLGYRNIRTEAGTHVALDPDTAPLVQAAFAHAAAGLPLRRILAKLSATGLRSRNGHPVGVSALWAILTNPFYTGKLRYHGALLPGNHPALVSEALFACVQAELARRCRRKRG